jgi:DNA-binding MarR family transcriptional regulator
MSSVEATLYDVVRHVRPLHQYLARAVADELQETNLTVAMRAVLEQLLDAREPLSVPQLAQRLWLPRQAVQRVVDAARDLGYVETRPNPGHRRSVLIAVTDVGRQAFEAVHAREMVVLGSVAEAVRADDAAACLRVIARLTDEFRSRTQAFDGPTAS